MEPFLPIFTSVKDLRSFIKPSLRTPFALTISEGLKLASVINASTLFPKPNLDHSDEKKSVTNLQ